MSVLCCGDNRDSCFCPQCGRQLKAHKLLSLLQYSQKQVLVLAGRMRSQTLLLEELRDPASQTNHRRTIEQLEKSKAMWEAWVAELQRVIEFESAE